MGLLSVCFDWNYIAGFGSPLWMPLQTLTNSFIGYLAGIAISMALYYGNVWRAMDFPFMSQLLYDQSSNTTTSVQYNETAILNPDFTVNGTLVDQAGAPFLTATYVNYLITSNAGLTATIVHMLLWNYAEVSLGWAWMTLTNLKKVLDPSVYMFWRHTGVRSEEEKQRIRDDPTIDPHYKLMLEYDEVPSSWYFFVFILSWIVGIVCLYVMKSTLPWWGFFIATIFLVTFMVFFGAQYAITGFMFNLQPIFQMLAGYMIPGRPLGMCPKFEASHIHAVLLTRLQPTCISLLILTMASSKDGCFSVISSLLNRTSCLQRLPLSPKSLAVSWVPF